MIMRAEGKFSKTVWVLRRRCELSWKEADIKRQERVPSTGELIPPRVPEQDCDARPVLTKAVK